MAAIIHQNIATHRIFFYRIFAAFIAIGFWIYKGRGGKHFVDIFSSIFASHRNVSVVNRKSENTTKVQTDQKSHPNVYLSRSISIAVQRLIFSIL